MKLPPTALLSCIVAAFWKHVRKGKGCWEWTGTRRLGYGRFKIAHKWFTAHRVAWELSRGRPIPSEKSVLHHCDNPPCCRPNHLYLGTQTQNMRDMIRRNRQRHLSGEENPRTKISDTQIKLLRSHYEEGATLLELAAEFKLSRGYVWKLVKGQYRKLKKGGKK